MLVCIPTCVCIFLELGFSSTFWSLSLIGSTFNSVVGTCCTTAHTKFHGILATLCPCDMSHEVQQVELRATCRGEKIRLFTVLYFSVRSPQSHANSETGAIFVYIASATWREDGNQYKQRWSQFRSWRAIVAILRKNRGL